MRNKIFIGADSAGYDLKCEVIAHLKDMGYEVTDCGTDSSASCHYPVFAKAVCVLADAIEKRNTHGNGTDIEVFLAYHTDRFKNICRIEHSGTPYT